MTPPLHCLPFPLAQINKKKGKIWVRTSESNRIDQKPETKKDGTYQFSRFYLRYMYPYTRTIFISLALSHARTHARTTPRSKKQPAFFLLYKGIPPRHKKSYRARNSRPANQSERERDFHFVSAISPSTTSSHLSTPHISTPFSTPRPPTRTTTTTAIQPSNDYITPHPTRSSFLIHPFNYKVCDKLVTVSQSISQSVSQSAKPSSGS